MNSQIDTITDHTGKLTLEQNQYEIKIKKELYEAEKKGKDTQKAKMGLEGECRNFEIQDRKESEEHYNFKMSLDKGVATGALSKDRYDRDLNLM